MAALKFFWIFFDFFSWFCSRWSIFVDFRARRSIRAACRAVEWVGGVALGLGAVCGLVWRVVWDWTAEMGGGLSEGRLRREKREAVSGLPLMGWGEVGGGSIPASCRGGEIGGDKGGR